MPADSLPEFTHASPAAGAPVTTSDMTTARAMLLLLAVLYFVGGCGFSILFFSLERKAGVAVAQAWPLPAGIFVSAFILPVILIGLAAIVKGQLNALRLQRAQFKSVEQTRVVIEYLQQTMSSVRTALLDQRTPNTSAAGPAANPSFGEPEPVTAATALTAAIDATNSTELLHLLTQIRDLALMTEAQRLERAAQLHRQRRDAFTAEIRQCINRQQWKAASGALEKFRSALPDDPLATELETQLSTARANRVRSDIDAVQSDLRQFMSINAWDRVEEIVGKLELAYPGDPQVEDLVGNVRREQQSWRAEELQRLLSDFHEATDHRRWRQACLIAQQLVERYPDEKAIDRIRVELATLRNNADAQDRQEMEVEFKDLLNRHRYEECLAVAEKMIDTYPDSKAAAELTKMLPKLHELIRQERVRRQQSAGAEQA